MPLPLELNDFGAKLMRLLPPEAAHKWTVKLSAMGLGAQVALPENPMLATEIAGIKLPNPIGLAAGFDKNAEVPNQMLDLGFGFVEVGAVTPLPQPGNPKPRVFRDVGQLAVINRYGFNNEGLNTIRTRLENREKRGVVGINLGANKESADRVEDFVKGLTKLEAHVDFATVNISSPNTPGLRALQSAAELEELLTRVLTARKTDTPVFLKIAPDLTDEDKSDIIAVAAKMANSGTPLNGLIATNTTMARPDTLLPQMQSQAGGLSGRPLFHPSTEVLKDIALGLKKSDAPDLPIIGVGGVGSAKQAYLKILNGATAVQLYTAMVFEGPSLVRDIILALPDFLQADGFNHISEAVGANL